MTSTEMRKDFAQSENDVIAAIRAKHVGFRILTNGGWQGPALVFGGIGWLGLTLVVVSILFY